MLEDLAHEEKSYFELRKTLKQHRKDHHAMVDQLCSLLKKRLERPETDSEEEEFPPNDGSYTIQRTNI